MKENLFKVLVIIVMFCILAFIVAGGIYAYLIYTRNVTEIQGELKQMASELEGKEKELQKEKELRALTEGKHQQLESIAGEHKDTIDELKQKTVELEKLNDDLARRRIELDRMMAEKQDEIYSLSEKNKLESAQHKEIITRLQSQSKLLKEQKESLSLELDGMQEEIGRLRKNNDMLNNELEQTKELVSELENDKNVKNIRQIKGELREKEESLREEIRKNEKLISEIEGKKKEPAKPDRKRRPVKSEKSGTKTAQEIPESAKTEDAKFYYNTALECQQTGDYKEALGNYEKALELDPLDPDIHYNIAILYDENLGENSKAAYHYRKYLELNPGAEDKNTVIHWIDEAEREASWGNNLQKFDFFKK
ncbi:MAG: tetratricopeptide repeat protein [Candidatus Aureabacteria bacterium]|nr:tetratricopeptide repeat protein [Candidatus Auribacterota bacterium]